MFENRPMSPCKDCQKRHEACWDRCEDYQSWVAVVRKMNEEDRKKDLAYKRYKRWKSKSQM